MSLTPPPPPPAPKQPALPLLGSALLDLETRYQGRFEERGREILTGIGVVDEELLGGRGRAKQMGMGMGMGMGFERGTVVGLSACEGIEGRLISLHLLASVLISNSDLNIDSPTKPHNISSATPVTNRTSTPTPTPTPKATIIDTAGSFPISLLAQVLKSRFRQAHQSSRPQHTVAEYSNRLRGDENDVHGKEDEDKWVDALAQRALERIAVCRVFDVEGLWEVLGEIGRDAGAEETTLTDQDDNIDTSTVSNLEGEAPHPLPEELSPRKEILDSQDQEQSDDEMLLEEHESTYHAVEPIRSILPTETDDPLKFEKPAKDDEEEDDDDDDDGVELIIVDNMTHLITELFSKKEKSEAHTHLALLTRALHTLTRHNNILTILHNTTVSSNPFNPTSNASHITHHDHNPPQNPDNYPFRPKTSSTRSVFPSNPLKPSLGLLFAPIPDLHLLLTRMPKRRQDAELLYAGYHNVADGELDAGTGIVEECLVLEILKDETAALQLITDGADSDGREMRSSEFGMRERKWAPLEVTEDGLSLKLAFDDDEASWQGVGQKRRGGGDKGKEPETGRERGFVPRMFGFGGRRG